MRHLEGNFAENLLRVALLILMNLKARKRQALKQHVVRVYALLW